MPIAPVDPNWATVDDGNSNIHRNKGSGFYFQAADMADNDDLVRFECSDTVNSDFLIRFIL